mgnify:CR=1 FL=1
MNDKRSRSSVIHLPVAIHKDPASVYGVSVPDLPGCFSAGETVEEAMENVREAIGFHIEGLLEDLGSPRNAIGVSGQGSGANAVGQRIRGRQPFCLERVMDGLNGPSVSLTRKRSSPESPDVS